jgi:hypothetical protein
MALVVKICQTWPCPTLFTSAMRPGHYLRIHYIAKFHKAAHTECKGKHTANILTENRVENK